MLGWPIADHLRTDVVVDALESAAGASGLLQWSRMHTEHGVQYTSSQFQSVCRLLGVVQSTGLIGSSADNAMAESFNATLKREALQGAKRWESETSCRAEVFRWIVRYNNRRKHSALGYRSPFISRVVFRLCWRSLLSVFVPGAHFPGAIPVQAGTSA